MMAAFCCCISLKESSRRSTGLLGENLPFLISSSHIDIRDFENFEGSTSYVLHPPTPSATPTFHVI